MSQGNVHRKGKVIYFTVTFQFNLRYRYGDVSVNGNIPRGKGNHVTHVFEIMQIL